jgi:hypothetical protein
MAIHVIACIKWTQIRKRAFNINVVRFFTLSILVMEK